MGQRFSTTKVLIGLWMATLVTACGIHTDSFWYRLVPHDQIPQERNYEIRPVEVVNPLDDVTLSAELTYPKDIPNPVAVVLISGADGGPPATKNYEITGHPYFLVLSDLLTKRGFAVLRFDNRGVGNSSGQYQNATDDDYASDAAALLRWVKNDSGLTLKSAGFVGHSQGGNKALLAARHEKPDFVVTLGTGVQSLKEVILTQNRDINQAAGVDPLDIDRQQRELQDIFDIVESASSLTAYQQALKTYLLNQGVTQPGRQAAIMATYGSRWWFTEAHRDAEQLFRNHNGPLLQLFGSQDLLVSIADNNERARAAVAHNRESEVLVFEGLNHLFQRAVKGTGPLEYWEINTTIEPEVVDTVVTWISNLEHSDPKRHPEPAAWP